MAWRIDTVPIAKTEQTPEGYLRCWGRIAKPGIQTYKDAAGNERREYRPESEVSAPESLLTWGGKVVTDEHPPELLTADNTSKYQKGFTGNQVHYSDGFVSVVLTVTDRDLIDKIRRGDAQELSCGYQVAPDYTPGEAPGMGHYDAVQRRIRGNHLAVVKQGRAGPAVRLLLDSLTADDSDVAEAVLDTQPTKQEVKPLETTKIRLDSDGHSSEIEVLASSAALLTARLDADRSKIAEMQARIDELEEENATTLGRADGIEAALADLKEQLEAGEAVTDGEDDDEEDDEEEDDDQDELIAHRVAERVRLLDQVRDFFVGDSTDFASMPDREIRTRAIQKLMGAAAPDDLDSRDDAYLVGTFDSLYAVVKAQRSGERSDAFEDLSNALKGIAPGGGKSPQAAQGEPKRKERWKQPLTASTAKATK